MPILVWSTQFPRLRTLLSMWAICTRLSFWGPSRSAPPTVWEGPSVRLWLTHRQNSVNCSPSPLRTTPPWTFPRRGHITSADRASQRGLRGSVADTLAGKTIFASRKTRAINVFRCMEASVVLGRLVWPMPSQTSLTPIPSPGAPGIRYTSTAARPRARPGRKWWRAWILVCGASHLRVKRRHNYANFEYRSAIE